MNRNNSSQYYIQQGILLNCEFNMMRIYSICKYYLLNHVMKLLIVGQFIVIANNNFQIILYNWQKLFHLLINVIYWTVVLINIPDHSIRENFG